MVSKNDCQAWSTLQNNYFGCPLHKLGALSIGQVRNTQIMMNFDEVALNYAKFL